MADQRSKPRNLWEMQRVNQFKTQCRIPAIVCGSAELHDYKFMLISSVLFCDFSPIGFTCPGADKALLLSLKATAEGNVKIFFPEQLLNVRLILICFMIYFYALNNSLKGCVATLSCSHLSHGAYGEQSTRISYLHVLPTDKTINSLQTSTITFFVCFVIFQHMEQAPLLVGNSASICILIN